jgi:hypothetical protein
MRINALNRKKAAKTTQRPRQSVTTRIVNERRWVHRNQLEIGMYVSELDRPWTETRFMFQGFHIDSHEMLQQVQESCEYAQVAQEKLARVSSNSTARLVGATRRSA